MSNPTDQFYLRMLATGSHDRGEAYYFFVYFWLLPESLLENTPLNVTSIPETCGLLTPEGLAVTELGATDVLGRIASGQLTAVETAIAFEKRAAIVHQLTACLTDVFLDERIEQGKALNKYISSERGRGVAGPLHGLPISIKMHRWGSGGFLSNVELSADYCDMTKILRKLGAVFHVKTDQPQTIMDLEPRSFCGHTLNPYNTNLSSGGSSGGESASVAMEGSCMGIGNDEGGSIRCPCAFTGLHGIRPSCKTTPMGGVIWYQPGHDGRLASSGSMCNSSRDMRLLVGAVLDVKKIAVRSELPDLSQGKLRVGIMTHDNVVLPRPPMLRATKLVKAKLEASPEVEVSDYVPFKHEEGCSIMNHDVVQAWEVRAKRDDCRHAYSDHWEKQGCDVVLCPLFSGNGELLGEPSSTGLISDPALDVADTYFTHFEANNDDDPSRCGRSTGGVVNLQVVSSRFDDGLVMAAQDVIGRIVKS
ncbi:hypothetical protein PAXRUDRAFT_33334 [Paxillus rubicundulus Ve08.2h10]|uniref:amidase n=1 Tax=Paxillus rubicundulus Ve08.2h10 TaxID=930991 RepID=A0A0D0E2F7_9AGAM|nr:hypothetical protein PAXRUDRAFT_33334 [Paxillus rubicundulus Ve08.2h10]